MSRVTTQSNPITSPDGLQLNTDPTARRVFGARPAVDETASQLLGVIQAAGQAVGTYGRVQQIQNERDLQNTYSSAEAEVRGLLNKLQLKDPTDEDFGATAASTSRSIDSIYQAYKSTFDGTKYEGRWAGFAGGNVGAAQQKAYEHQEKIRKAAENVEINSAALAVRTTALKIPDAVYEDLYGLFVVDSTKDQAVSGLQEHLFESMPQRFQDEVAERPDSRLSQAIQLAVVNETSKFITQMSNEAERQTREADKDTEKANITTASINISGGGDIDSTLAEYPDADKRDIFAETVDRFALFLDNIEGSSPAAIADANDTINRILSDRKYSDFVIPRDVSRLQQVQKGFISYAASELIERIPIPSPTSDDDRRKQTETELKQAFITAVTPLLSADDVATLGSYSGDSQVDDQFAALLVNPKTEAAAKRFFTSRIESFQTANAKIVENYNKLGNNATLNVDTRRRENSASVMVYKDPEATARFVKESPNPQIREAAENFLKEPDATSLVSLQAAARDHDTETYINSPEYLAKIDGPWIMSGNAEQFARAFGRVTKFDVQSADGYLQSLISQDGFTVAHAAALHDMMIGPNAELKETFEKDPELLHGTFKDLVQRYSSTLVRPENLEEDEQKKWDQFENQVEFGGKWSPLTQAARQKMQYMSYPEGLTTMAEIQNYRKIKLAESQQYLMETPTGTIDIVYDPHKATPMAHGRSLVQMNEDLLNPSSDTTHAISTYLKNTLVLDPEMSMEDITVRMMRYQIIRNEVASIRDQRNQGIPDEEIVLPSEMFDEDGIRRMYQEGEIYPTVSLISGGLRETMAVVRFYDNTRGKFIGSPYPLNMDMINDYYDKAALTRKDRWEGGSPVEQEKFDRVYGPKF